MTASPGHILRPDIMKTHHGLGADMEKTCTWIWECLENVEGVVPGMTVNAPGVWDEESMVEVGATVKSKGMEESVQKSAPVLPQFDETEEQETLVDDTAADDDARMAVSIHRPAGPDFY